MMKKTKTMAVVGPGGIGKSTILIRLINNIYTGLYDPTIEDSYKKTFNIDDTGYDFEILGKFYFNLISRYSRG